ncbi:MAG: radical SAM protein [Candidatus Omnitrophica bacterium]|nr:radical SAM protein [Candidatus Omnitrophota bacterium]
MDLTVISTYRCNSKCQMCYIWQNPSHPQEEVSLATLSKLPGGFDNLNISGGEPTLRKDLPQLVDLLHSKARITEISSNGLYPERLAPIIRKYPNTKVRFSLEGDELTNNCIRGESDGFQIKVKGLQMLKELGGTDLGFALVIQDENAPQLTWVHDLAGKLGVELSTSSLHNAWQFHKNDNHFYDRLKAAKEVEKLITAMLRTNSVKSWFRGYLNLGLIKNILGQDRLIKCTAGKDFAFIDPWSDVWACNVRTDLPMGNLKEQSWTEIISSPAARQSRALVADCRQNCWMVTTARTAMRSNAFPAFPKLEPLRWVLENKIKTALGMDIAFDRYINYEDVRSAPQVQRQSFLDKSYRSRLQKATDPHYTQKEYVNR